MPIRPENRARYPADWPKISLRIRRDRAGWRCEQIGPDGTRCKARQGEPHPITGSKVVLTTAHLDHTPEHVADHNLLACCQRCHLAYDLEHHRRNAAKRRRQEMATAEMFGAANAQ